MLRLIESITFPSGPSRLEGYVFSFESGAKDPAGDRVPHQRLAELAIWAGRLHAHVQVLERDLQALMPWLNEEYGVKQAAGARRLAATGMPTYRQLAGNARNVGVEVRETLVELDRNHVAHISLRGGSDQELAQAMSLAEALRFDDVRLSIN